MGLLDLIVDRREMKIVLGRALRFMGAQSAQAVPAPTMVADAVDAGPPR